MEDKNSECQIPEGWKSKSQVRKDGTKSMNYWCPATGQHFYTYEDLMRYVNYAKAAQVGIYAQADSSQPQKKAGFKPRRNKTSFAARRRLMLGQSSRPLPFNQGKGSGESEGGPDPVQSTDTGKNMEVNEAGDEAGLEPGSVIFDIAAVELLTEED